MTRRLRWAARECYFCAVLLVMVLAFVDAGRLGMRRFWTAAQALYHPTRLGLVEPPEKAPGDRDEWVLVYGGSCESLSDRVLSDGNTY